MLQIKNTLGGGKPEGLYAWKKHSVSVLDNLITKSDKNYILGTATSDTTVYYSTSYTFDASTGMYALVNPQSATLAYNGSGGVYSVQMEKSKYYIWGATSSNEIYNTNANSKYNVAIRNASGTVYLELNASDYKCDIHSAKKEYTFLDYIVSDKETAYPDGAVHTDGYYYEKVMEGKQVVTGSFTVGYADTSKITITHDLGVEPYLFIAISPYVTSSGQCSMLLYCADELGYGDYPIVQTYGGTMSRDVNKTFYSAGITSCVISAADGWGTKSSNTVYWIAIG